MKEQACAHDHHLEQPERRPGLLENIQPEHLSSKHHADQLIERVGWAVTDAKEAEDTGR
jgi:hypothetical protein